MLAYLSQLRDFNPRSREGSDDKSLVRTYTRKLFQSTLPRRERQVENSYWFDFKQFQSTLPRRERQFMNFLSDRLDLISIHAPAKGATLLRLVLHVLSMNFNPRSREGSD